MENARHNWSGQEFVDFVRLAHVYAHSVIEADANTSLDANEASFEKVSCISLIVQRGDFANVVTKAAIANM
jgi:hypothetical protein